MTHARFTVVALAGSLVAAPFLVQEHAEWSVLWVALAAATLGATLIAATRPSAGLLEVALVCAAAQVALLGAAVLSVGEAGCLCLVPTLETPDAAHLRALWLAIAVLAGGAVGVSVGRRPERALAPLLLAALAGAHAHWQGLAPGPAMACALGAGAFGVAGLREAGEPGAHAPAARTLAALTVAAGLVARVVSIGTDSLPHEGAPAAYGRLWFYVGAIAAQLEQLPWQLVGVAALLAFAWLSPVLLSPRRDVPRALPRGDVLPAMALVLGVVAAGAFTLDGALAPVDAAFDERSRRRIEHVERLPVVPGPEAARLPWPLRARVESVRGVRLVAQCAGPYAIREPARSAQGLATFAARAGGAATVDVPVPPSHCRR